jgi:hypothetical protein
LRFASNNLRLLFAGALFVAGLTLVASALAIPGQTIAEANGGQHECRWQEDCKTKTPTATPETPTATPETPTATPETPTSTPVTPTSTSQPPTATPQDPTATPEDPSTPTPTGTTEPSVTPVDEVLSAGPTENQVEEVLALPASGGGASPGSGLSLVVGLLAMAFGGFVWLTGTLWSSARRDG